MKSFSMKGDDGRPVGLLVRPSEGDLLSDVQLTKQKR